MSALAQDMLTLAAVGIAAAWLVRTWWLRRARATCDGCSPRSIAARTTGRGVRPSALRVLR